MSNLGLLADLLSEDELKNHINKSNQKANRRGKKPKPTTGVVQKKSHAPFKRIRTEWKFVEAVVRVHTQECLCGECSSQVNRHVLFRYERKCTYRTIAGDDVTLDTHETYRPRKDVELPHDINITKEYLEPEQVGVCDACIDDHTLISTELLLSTIADTFLPDEIEPKTEGEEAIIIDGSDEDELIFMDNAALMSLMEEQEDDA